MIEYLDQVRNTHANTKVLRRMSTEKRAVNIASNAVTNAIICDSTEQNRVEY